MDQGRKRRSDRRAGATPLHATAVDVPGRVVPDAGGGPVVFRLPGAADCRRASGRGLPSAGRSRATGDVPLCSPCRCRGASARVRPPGGRYEYRRYRGPRSADRFAACRLRCGVHPRGGLRAAFPSDRPRRRASRVCVRSTDLPLRHHLFGPRIQQPGAARAAATGAGRRAGFRTGRSGRAIGFIRGNSEVAVGQAGGGDCGGAGGVYAEWRWG